MSTNPQKIGRYEIKHELGRGGMATVYLAHDPRFKRDVALKVLPRQFTHDPMFRARFEREAQTIATLEHHAIVPVYDFGEEDEQPFLVMRYMTGGTLNERIFRGAIPLEETIKIIGRIGAALDFAHSKGIIHRDLKPENILFDQHQNAFLSDFGIVKLAQATTTFTGKGILGTPAYMSPEQARGTVALDGRSDIYTLGVILFEMLSGQQPYRAETPIGLAMMHISEPIPSVRTINPNLPPAYEHLLNRALAKVPDERFQTAAALAHSVATLAHAGTELLPEPANHSEDDLQAPAVTNQQTKRQIPPWLWLTAVVGLLLLVWGISSLWGGGDEPIAAESPGNGTKTAVAILPAAFTETPTLEPAATVTPTFTATAREVPTETAVPSPTPTLSPSFIDVPLSFWAYEYIEAVYQEGYIAGCSTDPPMYCPEYTLSREEMAVLIMRGVHGPDFDPLPPTDQVFADVPVDRWSAKWINAMYLEGYTAGCNTEQLAFCPEQTHTRAEGAVLALRMLHGVDYVPEPPTEPLFADVPVDIWFAKWVTAAFNEGLLAPCQTEPELQFCPDQPLTRAMMAQAIATARQLLSEGSE